nr:hypothetical protein [Tanacetum cinerariifolium]
MNQNNFEPNHSGFDQPSQYSIDHQPLIIQQDLNMKLISDELMIEQRNELFKAMQSMFEEFRQREQAANLSTHTFEPSRRFNFICNDDDDDDDDEEITIPLRDIISQLPPSIVITTSPPVLPTFEDPEDSLIIRNEDLSNFIPSESEDTSGSDSDCDLSACENNFMSGNPTLSFDYEVESLSSSIPYEDSDPLLEETDILLSHFDDSLPEYETFSFDIEEKSSCGTTTHSDYSLSDYEAFYFHDDHIEDKSSGSTTTHSDFSLPEYDSFIFDLSIDPFPPTDRSVSHHEEFADELTHIYLHQKYSETDLLVSFPSGNKDKVFDPGISKKTFSPTYVRLPFKDHQYLFFTYVVRILLLYFTYPVVSPFLLSSGSEDTIFDLGIFAIHFSHRSGTFMCFNVYLNVLNESPMEICSSTYFYHNITMIWDAIKVKPIGGNDTKDPILIALWQSQREDQTTDWFRVVLIYGLGQTMNGISAGKKVDIGVGGGRDKALRPADAVTLMKRIRKFSVAQDIGARAVIHIFNRIDFSIAKGVGAQLVSRLPSVTPIILMK